MWNGIILILEVFINWEGLEMGYLYFMVVYKGFLCCGLLLRIIGRSIDDDLVNIVWRGGMLLLEFFCLWKYCVFVYCIFRRFKLVSRLCFLLRGLIVWLFWLEWNDVIFNGMFWWKEKMYIKIWLCMVDYGWIVWS